MPALRHPKNERFAQALSLGRSYVDAAQEAEFKLGSSFESNARKRAQRPDVRHRVRELRASGELLAEYRALVTRDWMLYRLHCIADPDLGRDAIKVSDQIAAIKLSAQLTGDLVEKIAPTSPDGSEAWNPVAKVEFTIVDATAASAEGVRAVPVPEKL